jgi:Na+/proline symporter/nitrogen-specific signal transduction histidine kinase
MLQGWVILSVAALYLGVLFFIASWADKRADAGNSVINNPYIYTLSIAVYCTAWTFYGSVGRAAVAGVGFLPIYIGPTLIAVLWWFVLRKIIRIAKVHRITTIADFIASRYGKASLLGGLVTMIAVIGIMPYISLQLKAVSTSFNILLQYPEIIMPINLDPADFVHDTAFYVALLMAAFTILFGTRHIDATEHHEGMVAAVAFESVIKLIAFLAVGIFVTFGIYDGFGDIFSRAAEVPELKRLFTLEGASVATEAGAYGTWISFTVLSMMAILFLPRQFQVAVIENTDEDHLHTSVWLFPLYLLAINIFVLPIALGGLLHFSNGAVDADTFVLTLPMAEQKPALALLVFIGGLSAATAMVIVATIALSTMVCNDLVMPILLRIESLRITQYDDLSGLLLGIRRIAIGIIVGLGYVYFRLIGESYALVTIGLVSFTAAAQFAPAILGGIYWNGGSRRGALAGLSMGFGVWVYTLLLPAFAQSGWLDDSFVNVGPWGLELLKPYALFGLDGLDNITHALVWSMLLNIGAYVGVSLIDTQTAIERTQAALFVNVFKYSGDEGSSRFWRGTASVADLKSLVARFIGRRASNRQFQTWAEAQNVDIENAEHASPQLVHFTERLLAGSVGAASSRILVSTVVKEEPMGIDEVMAILRETSQVIEHSRQLEEKTHEVERAYAELRDANQRLTELDRLKDNFLSAVTHELRTPLTSIRSFSEILHDNPELKIEQRREFLAIIVRETERLTRLINEVLDIARLESGEVEWRIEEFNAADIIDDAVTATRQLMIDAGVTLQRGVAADLPPIPVDRDRLIQVIINLLANAIKFADARNGQVAILARPTRNGLEISVSNNGPGIRAEDREVIFEKFRQVEDDVRNKRTIGSGTGLGLAICREIIEFFGGRIWVDSQPGDGATFTFLVPYAEHLESAE